MTNILLTGSTGFIGQQLSMNFPDSQLRFVIRRKSLSATSSRPFYVDAIDSNTDWAGAFDNVEVVIHLAGLAHNKKLRPSSYIEVNTEGTINLAKQAAEAGIKRFIFLSSIGVNGNTSHKPFTENDTPAPFNAYTSSKYEAEKELLAISQATEMEVVIIRPPLVYGPGAPGNFASLLKLSASSFPLPFGSIRKNKRSLVSIDNLISLIRTCIGHPKAANQIFLVSDDGGLSTKELVQKILKGLGKHRIMFPVPLWCYNLAGKILGKQEMVNSLIGSLQVDISKTKELLDWSPIETVEEGLMKAVADYTKQKNK